MMLNTTDNQFLYQSIYKRLGLRGIARMDFIVTEEKKPYLIEVNTTPGMSERSIVPQQIAAAGKTMKSVFTELIQTI